jgi:hypothetical protein
MCSPGHAKWVGWGAVVSVGTACLMAGSMLSASPAGEAGDLETLIRGVQHRERSIMTLRGYLAEAEYSYQPEQGLALFQVEFVLAAGRARYAAASVIGTPGNHWEIWPGADGPWVRFPDLADPVRAELPRIEIAEDGRVRVEYSNLNGAARIGAQGEATAAVARPPFSSLLLLGTEGGVPWGLYLANAASHPDEHRVALAEGEADEPQAEVVAVDTPAPEHGTDWAERFWVRPSWGYAVVRCETTVTTRDTGAVARVIVTEGLGWRELAPGLWLPGETRMWYSRQDRYPAQPLETLRRAVFSALQVNTPVTEDDFRLHLPIGVRISNDAGVALPPGIAENTRAVGELREIPPPKAPDLHGAPRAGQAARPPDARAVAQKRRAQSGP